VDYPQGATGAAVPQPARLTFPETPLTQAMQGRLRSFITGSLHLEDQKANSLSIRELEADAITQKVCIVEP
jgi:hypothetical protein